MKLKFYFLPQHEGGDVIKTHASGYESNRLLVSLYRGYQWHASLF